MQGSPRRVTRGVGENGGSQQSHLDHHNASMPRDKQQISKRSDSDQDRKHASDSWVPSQQSNRRPHEGNGSSIYQPTASESRSSPLHGELCFPAAPERQGHYTNGSRSHTDSRQSLPRSREVPPLPETGPLSRKDSMPGTSRSRREQSTEVRNRPHRRAPRHAA
jgi:hypothetical protein